MRRRGIRWLMAGASALLLAGSVTLGTACDRDEGAFEETGESVEEGAEETGEAFEEGAEETGERMD